MIRRTPNAWIGGIAMLLLIAAPAVAQTQPGSVKTQSLLDFVKGGGVVGYIIIALSVAALAIVIDTLLRLRRETLLPTNLVKQSLELAETGRVNELTSINKANDSMFGRVVGGAMDRAKHGIDAVRQEMQQLGEAEILKLRYRVGYIAVAATAAPMLGLLGTVIGMIDSFGVLGASRNAAKPDELAVGISVALVTTCQGLILAVPLIFVHAYLRDKVSAVAQQAAHTAEKIISLLAVSPANPARPAPRPAATAGPAITYPK